MKFSRLGHIFDPREYEIFGRRGEFAQSPQAIVLDDRVRVYFSTRERDSLRSFLSHPCYVDIDLKFKSVLGIAKDPVISLGALGTFDEHGIFPFSPLKLGNKVYAYTTGWTRRKSVSIDSGIGLAVSVDQGKTFQKSGQGPILSASLHEPFLVSDGFVLKDLNLFHMWYIFGERWIEYNDGSDPDRVYKIAHATSPDGIKWLPSNQRVIPDTLGRNECQALPSVVKYEDEYIMVYCYRHATGFRTDPNKGYRLGCARSIDLKTWTVEELHLDGPAENGWDADMQCYPNLLILEGELYLLYNGNKFGMNGFGVAKYLS